MKRTLAAAVGLIAALCFTAPAIRAAVFTETLGHANWADGQTNIGTGNFAAGGDPPPFDTLIGNKSTGPNPSTSFTFSGYGGPIGDPISSATIEFGLYDGASPDPSAQVQFFTLNATNDLASILTTALVAVPAIRDGEIYYTLNLPGAAFAALATGTSVFALGFQGPGVGLLGPSDFILFGLDFATLTINTTQNGPSIPEPSTLLVLLTGLGGLLALTRRMQRRPDHTFVNA